MRFHFFIRQLNIGGAQSQLLDMAIYLKNEGHNVSIITIYGGGDLISRAKEADINHIVISDKKINFVSCYLRLLRIIRSNHIDHLISYSPLTSVFSILSKPFSLNMKVIWYLRNSSVDLTGGYFKNKLIYFLQSKLSKYTDLILANSMAGKEFYTFSEKLKKNIDYLPNFINTKLYKFNLTRRDKYRKFLKYDDSHVLIGIVGRVHKDKNHDFFLDIANKLLKKNLKYKFVIVGNISDRALSIKLKDKILYYGIEKSIKWIDHKNDLIDIYSSLDILISTSLTEGFSNVLAESVSCGTFTIANNVGDSKYILSEDDKLIQNNSLTSYLDACQKFDENDVFIKEKRNKWIYDNFSRIKIAHEFINKIENLK